MSPVNKEILRIVPELEKQYHTVDRYDQSCDGANCGQLKPFWSQMFYHKLGIHCAQSFLADGCACGLITSFWMIFKNIKFIKCYIFEKVTGIWKIEIG